MKEKVLTNQKNVMDIHISPLTLNLVITKNLDIVLFAVNNVSHLVALIVDLQRRDWKPAIFPIPECVAFQ